MSSASWSFFQEIIVASAIALAMVLVVFSVMVMMGVL